MTEEKAKRLLQKYLSGHATASEEKRVEEWYLQIEQKDIELPETSKDAIKVEMLQKLRSSMLQETTPQAQQIPLYRQFLKIAAIFLVCISIGFLIWNLQSSKNTSGEMIMVSTGIGERKKIILSDGSEIILEPAAKLRYPSRFSSSSRRVSLYKGEAFFNISHDVKRPFTVATASGLDVKVLGTSFRIKNNPRTKHMEVVVATGKVAVVNRAKVLGTLVKDQQLDYDKTTGSSSISPAKYRNIVAIDFVATTLQDVLNQLEYLYAIKIHLKNTDLASLKCTANFNSGQEPEEILDIICSLHQIKFKAIEKDKVFELYR